MNKPDWKKYPVLFSLYIAQAVPMSFFTTVIPVIMRQENYSLEAIGLLQLVKLPWILKFLWAPLIDNYTRNLRDYKRWIYTSEIFYALSILLIGQLSLQADFTVVIFLMVLAVTFSATQDIATDAFAIHILKRKERGYGNSMQSAGAFAGSLIGSGVLLIIYHYLGWSYLLFFLAIFVLIAIIPLMLYKRNGSLLPAGKKRVGMSELFLFFKTRGKILWTLVLFLYYSGITGIMTMIKPYLVDLGYNAVDIGLMAGITGTLAALVAAIFAGYIVKKTGYVRSMVYFLMVSLLAGVYFYLVGFSNKPSTGYLYAGIILLWTAYGSSSVAIYTAAMDMVRVGREGTDFTLQIVITHLSGLSIGVMSGRFAGLFGYQKLFLTEALLSLLVLILVFLKQKQITQSANIID